MSSRIHPQARTTPKIRQEIKDSGLSSREAAKVFNITRATAQKWLGRDDVQDRSHRAHTLKTTLSQAQEAIVLALRQSLYLPLDDLLFITKQYINPAVSRAGIARLLKREGMSRLTDLIATAEGEKVTPKKTFKDYEPGFIHIDIKYLPQMPDETSRRYLFVAIDRATRWVFMHVYGDMTEASSVDFLRRLKLASPIKISKILTDNGSQFTDRFATKDKKPSGKHAFDLACAALPAEHRLAPPRHPQTNGMVERFNGRINELLQQTRFDCRADLHATLMNYLKLYNHHIPQRALDAKTPILALKDWQQKRPELFVKRVYDQTGLDSYIHRFVTIRARISAHKYLFIQVLRSYPFAYMLAGMDKDAATLLREIKDASGWSEPRIAREIGTSQPTVNRILNGQSDCLARTLKAIEKVHKLHCRTGARKSKAISPPP